MQNKSNKFRLAYKMKNKWKLFTIEIFVYALPLSLFLEVMHADWSFENMLGIRFLFYFLCFALFGVVKNYLLIKSRENQLKEWENR